MFGWIGYLHWRQRFTATALYDVARNEKPEWTVTAYLDSRIKAGPKEGILSTTNLGGGLMVQTRIAQAGK
jgi:hypothetical protein